MAPIFTSDAMTTPATISDGLQHGRALGLRYRLALPQAALRGRDGVRLGTAAGASLDFHDYRDYHPGDDLRHLDWSVYARSDREVIKLFREEVAPHLDLVIDTSRSMALAESPKGCATATLVAACATAAAQAQCSRTIWFAGNSVRRLPNSNDDPTTWSDFELDDPMPPHYALLSHTPTWRQHGLRIFISDLMWPADPLPLVSRLAHGAAGVTVIQLLATAEEKPAPGGATRLEDVESGERLELLLDHSACAAYTRALAHHRDTWSTACRACGAAFVTLTAEELISSERLAPLESYGVLEAVGQ